jgi:hypothetical protein
MSGLPAFGDRGNRRFGAFLRRLQQSHYIFIEFHCPNPQELVIQSNGQFSALAILKLPLHR